MERNNKGISLIVLVITVIVMIILAGSVIISLSNSGIIGKANEAVDANNLKQVQQLASLAWAEAYMDKMTDSTVDLKTRVEAALATSKVDTSKYIINVTDSGVSVEKPTLGNLIKSGADYGKIVDYSANGINEWQVFYEDEVNGYVFLVAKDSLKNPWDSLDVSNLTLENKEIYNIFRLGQPGRDLSNPPENVGEWWGGAVSTAALIANYGDFINKKDYGEYVVGAIGSPTPELVAAGWNAKGYEPTMTVTFEDLGYCINGEVEFEVAADELYVPSDYSYTLAAPSRVDDAYAMCIGNGQISHNGYNGGEKIRPVVCLKSDIPAITTANGYSLIK